MSRRLYRNCGYQEEDEYMWQYGSHFYQLAIPIECLDDKQQQLYNSIATKSYFKFGIHNVEFYLDHYFCSRQAPLMSRTDHLHKNDRLGQQRGIYEIYIGNPAPYVRELEYKDANDYYFVGSVYLGSTLRTFEQRIIQEHFNQQNDHLAPLYAACLSVGYSLWIRFLPDRTPQVLEKYLLNKYSYPFNRGNNSGFFTLTNLPQYNWSWEWLIHTMNNPVPSTIGEKWIPQPDVDWMSYSLQERQEYINTISLTFALPQAKQFRSTNLRHLYNNTDSSNNTSESNLFSVDDSTKFNPKMVGDNSKYLYCIHMRNVRAFNYYLPTRLGSTLCAAYCKKTGLLCPNKASTDNFCKSHELWITTKVPVPTIQDIINPKSIDELHKYIPNPGEKVKVRKGRFYHPNLIGTGKCAFITKDGLICAMPIETPNNHYCNRHNKGPKERYPYHI